ACVNAELQELAEADGFRAVLLPVQSVGVQGDSRSYSYMAAIQGDWSKLDWPTIRNLAQKIPNRIHKINRVALLLNDRTLPARVDQVTPTLLNAVSLEKLRQLDHIVTSRFVEQGLYGKISQLFTVLLPIDTVRGDVPKHSAVIRAVITSDYMTARPAALGPEIPMQFIRNLAEELSAQPNVDLVLYDVTSKPPATVEWE
ncbi:MAG TPA: hypothetical protein V6C99_00930, partial [Oculatellaceae cyanobacterium]